LPALTAKFASMTIYTPGMEAPTAALSAEVRRVASLPDVERLPIIKELPNPFVLESGKPVATKDDWAERRREIRAMLLGYEYGHLPPPGEVRAQASSSLVNNWGARQEHITLSCGPQGAVAFGLDLLIPQGRPGPFPIILTGDAGLTPIPAEVVARGTILAQFDRTQIAPDEASRSKGVYALYPDADWGALAAWAWGYGRVVDYLLTRPDVDAERVAIAGHSRGGKAVLLGGAG